MHGIGILVFVAIRLAVYLNGKRSGQTSTQPTGFKPYVVRLSGLAIRAAFLSFAWFAWAESKLSGWFVLCLICGLPWLVIELVLVPAGIPRLAYYFTRLLYPHALFGEPRGQAVFNELRARLRWGWLLAPRSIARLEQNLIAFNAHGNDRVVRASSLAARATLDALAGDGEHARELFAVVQTMDWRQATRAARGFSQAWLLSDAARRGAFHEVVRHSWHGPLTCRARFMRASALRILGHGNAPARWKVVALWLWAPARHHTFGLLRRALRAESRPELSTPELGLTAARRRSFELMRLPRGSVTRDELVALARTWQVVFDSGEVRESLTERRMALQGTFDVGAVEARFERQIVTMFSQLLLTTLPDGDSEAHSPLLLLAAIDQLQSDWFGELEDLCRSLPRGEARTTDDLERHWRSWARVRQLASQLADVLPERAALIYASVGGEILNHGAWLYNKEKAQTLAHDMFYFLLGIVPKGDTNWRAIRQNTRLSA